MVTAIVAAVLGLLGGGAWKVLASFFSGFFTRKGGLAAEAGSPTSVIAVLESNVRALEERLKLQEAECEKRIAALEQVVREQQRDIDELTAALRVSQALNKPRAPRTKKEIV